MSPLLTTDCVESTRREPSLLTANSGPERLDTYAAPCCGCCASAGPATLPAASATTSVATSAATRTASAARALVAEILRLVIALDSRDRRRGHRLRRTHHLLLGLQPHCLLRRRQLCDRRGHRCRRGRRLGCRLGC